MSDYVKMGNGMLFKNEKRDNDKAPVWTGTITIVNKDGSERKARMAAWKSDKHKDGISIQLSEANAPSQATQGDEIPF